MSAWRVRVARSSIVAASIVGLTSCTEPSQTQSYEPNYALVFFDSGSTSLNKQAKQKLSDVMLEPTEPIKAVLKPDSPRMICVTGHADAVGSESDNKELGQRRAVAVAKYLIELGAPEKRIIVSSLGSAKPLVVTPRNTSAAPNRRVEVVFGCEAGR
jgi:outer membrane protein OmpA-like peptidoglycan-associated protein